jgi:hypothetical protein
MKCCICGGSIEVVGDWKEGHNAQPVADGRCCGWCNDSVVIPVRLKIMFDSKPVSVQKGGE